MAKNIYVGVKETYKFLEYIESNGTQYINTGISAPNGFVVNADFIPTSIPTSGEATIIGCEINASPWQCNWVRISNTTLFQLGAYSSYPSNLKATAGQRYKVNASTVKGESYLTIDEVNLLSQTNTSARSSNIIYLFANNKAGTAAAFISMKLYSLQILIDGNLVYDFVPAKRNSDNSIGLYNRVSKLFYTNAGTGTFIAGAETGETITLNEARESKKIYVGIDGIAHRVKKVYIGDETGVAKQVYEATS